MLHHPARAGLHIPAVLRLGGYAREPHILAEFAYETRLVLLQVINDACIGLYGREAKEFLDLFFGPKSPLIRLLTGDWEAGG